MGDSYETEAARLRHEKYIQDEFGFKHGINDIDSKIKAAEGKAEKTENEAGEGRKIYEELEGQLK